MSAKCPQCGSDRLYRAGLRYLAGGGNVQRWLCRNCGFRFSKSLSKLGEKLYVFGKAGRGFESGSQLTESSIRNRNLFSKEVGDDSAFSFREDVVSHGVTVIGKDINRLRSYSCNHQVCVKQKAKNLAAEIQKVENPRRNSEVDVKGKLVSFALQMQKQGYAPETIRGDSSCLKALLARGANLNDPESVKLVLAKENKWSASRKSNAINAYTLFLKFQGARWDKPKCRVDLKFPFIPTEQEIDALIAGSGKKNAALLQLLKETAMRSGEAKRLQWINIDSEHNIVTLNQPEKGSNPRMWKVSRTVIEMLNALPKTCEQVFAGSLKSMKTTFTKNRKRLAATLQNPRLNRIHFHTLRHWKATALYHQTKDPYYVQHFLGHKSLKSTEIYINIEHTLFDNCSNDEFTVKVAASAEEIKVLLETGFEYVCQKDDLVFLRKRR